MRLLAMLASLLLAGSAAAAELPARCVPQPVADVELAMKPDGRVYLPASLNGHDVYFELSIGTGLPTILESAIGPLGLKARPRVGGADLRVAGQRITHFASLEKLKVGNYSFLDRAAPLLPIAEPPEMLQGRPVVGRMGSTLIQNIDAELHLAERRLRLFKPFRCVDHSPVYWGGEAAALPMRFDEAQTLVFALEVDGKRVESSLLNGSRVSNIDVNATREFFGFDETSDGIVRGPATESGETGVFHAMSLTSRELSITDVPVALRPGSRQCKVGGSVTPFRAIGYDDCLNAVPFNIGTDLLVRMRVYIARKRNTIYVSVVDAAPAGAPGSIVVSPGR